MNPIAIWRAWLTARRLARVAAQAEHRRAVIKQQIAARVEKHAQRSRHKAMLFEATCMSLGATSGRPDLASRITRMLGKVEVA